MTAKSEAPRSAPLGDREFDGYVAEHPFFDLPGEILSGRGGQSRVINLVAMREA